QADAYKTDPSASHEKELINWWSVVARYFGQTSPLLGFDLIYEQAPNTIKYGDRELVLTKEPGSETYRATYSDSGKDSAMTFYRSS
ncbi:DUF4765 family protein, partial [Salmonella enterica subsp. enterica serovar Lubbock]|nr:DUF4765 family protein [Salmonella enterica subsp. enterica serovar Lubbock]